MPIVSVDQAARELEDCVRMALDEEAVVLTMDGRPVVALVSLDLLERNGVRVLEPLAPIPEYDEITDEAFAAHVRAGAWPRYDGS